MMLDEALSSAVAQLSVSAHHAYAGCAGNKRGDAAIKPVIKAAGSRHKAQALGGTA